MFVTAQPQAPAQQCVVRKGWGTIGTADVTDVEIVCGEFSYVANAASDTISAYSVDATTGAFASGGAAVAAGLSPHAMTIGPDKSYLYVGNSDGNDVSVFAIDGSSGALTTVPGSPFAAGGKPTALSFYSAAYVVYGPPTLLRYLYVANAGSDNLSAYRLDLIPGTLNRFAAIPKPLSPASYATGAGPSSLVVDEGYGPFLCTANSGGSNDISAYLIDIYTGNLTPIAGSPYPAANPGSLAFGAAGKFLYAANAGGGAATILGFSVDPSSGTLTGLPGFPVAVGASADSVSIDPTNQFLYVRNGSAGNVAGFEPNGATGALNPMPGSPFAVGTSADFIGTC